MPADSPALRAARSIDTDAALTRLLELLSISAPTGEERPVAEYLLTAIERAGIPESAVRVDDAPSRIHAPCQTGNVIVLLDGTLPGPRRLLSAHMDTVPLARGADPVVRDGRIVPRGTTALGGDDRTGVAAVLTALCELRRAGLPHPALTVLFTVREESGLRGAAAVRIEDLGGAELAFNFDGGLPGEITLGATGAVKMDLAVRGVAAHAGVHPERGVSAVAIFAAAVANLDRGGWLGLIRKPEGSGTSNIGAVKAGEATNVVTDRLEALAEARSHDPAFLKCIVEAYRGAFVAASREHRNEAGQEGAADLHVEEAYASFQLAEDAPAVRAAIDAASAVGLSPRTRISNGGLDANWLTRKGLPAVSLGCGQHEIHTTAEYVVIDQYLAACRLALVLAAG